MNKQQEKRTLEYLSVLGSEEEDVGVRVDCGTHAWKAWIAYLHDRKLHALRRHMLGKGARGSMWMISEFPP